MKRSWPAVGALAAALGMLAGPVKAQEALSLGDSIATALQRNPQLAAARHARESARIEAERFKPAFRPDVQASVSQIVRGPRLTFPKRQEQVTVLPNARTKLELDAQQPVLALGVGKAPRERYQALTEAADADYDKAELDLCLQVSEAYFTALQAQALERVAVEAVQMAQEQRRVTGLLVDAGQLALIETAKAETSLAEAEAGEVRARNGARLAVANLNRLLGRSVTAGALLEPVEGLPQVPPEMEALLPRAIAERPEAQALRARIDAAEAGVRLARSQRLPRVNGEMNYQLQNPSAFVPTSQWLVGLTAVAPVFETAAIRFNVRQAEEGLAQARAGLRALEQGIALEIEQARLSMIEAQERLQVADRALEQARQVLDTTQYAFEKGYAIQAEVEGARLSVTRAEGDRTRAIYDMWAAEARLRRALGCPCEGRCGEDGDGGRPSGGAPKGKP
jgi:outer membrane protein TolC